jgi:peptide/nickel transport system substrate-binding protein
MSTRRSASTKVLFSMVAVLTALALSGVSADAQSGSSGLPRVTGPVGTNPKGGKPVNGGTLNATAAMGQPLGLDPIKNAIDGTTGLTEYAAIYDVLMRYDPVARKYEPQLAESLTASADNKVYTLKLRPNVKFTDGTTLDAAAVKSNVERFSSSDSIQYYFSVLPEIASIDTPDNLTVVFNLTTSDAQFPWLLTQGPGLVVSPTAVAQKGEEAFNLDPVGAGPFKVSKFTSGSELDLVANPDYWGAKPHLDGIHFTWPAEQQARVQAMQNGDLDMAQMLTDTQSTLNGLKSGLGGFMWLRYGNPVLLQNERSGHPASDVKVRQAIAYAVDPAVINARVYGNTGYSTTTMFPTGALSSGTPGVKPSVAKAKELVKSAKAAGWDGSIRILAPGDQTSRGTALAVQAQLNNVGFNSTIDTAPSVSAFVDSVYIKYDYDIAVTSDLISESDPWAQLAQEVSGDFNPNGYKSPEMDAALASLQTATTPTELKAATKSIQTLFNQDEPEVWLGVGQSTLLYGKKLRGVVPSANSSVLLGNAWLAK